MVPFPSLCQAAFGATDLERTHGWYRALFGFLPSGGTRIVRGPLFSRMVGLPNLATTIWFLVDKQDFFHFEMFRFERPRYTGGQRSVSALSNFGTLTPLGVARVCVLPTGPHSRALLIGQRGQQSLAQLGLGLEQLDKLWRLVRDPQLAEHQQCRLADLAILVGHQLAGHSK